ncbi:unnamed protein product [Calypogeia fissa]
MNMRRDRWKLCWRRRAEASTGKVQGLTIKPPCIWGGIVGNFAGGEELRQARNGTSASGPRRSDSGAPCLEFRLQAATHGGPSCLNNKFVEIQHAARTIKQNLHKILRFPHGHTNRKLMIIPQ